MPPDIADDTEATTRETRRLFDALALPNVFIKIPATAAGVPAIRASIAGGINVNVTLIFSIQRYREVDRGLPERAGGAGRLRRRPVPAGQRGLVLRQPGRHPCRQGASGTGRQGRPQAEAARARLGTAAIDNAKLAYEVFQQAFSGPRWEALARQGARVQRPLWASTSTKNPDYRDVLYVEELIARDTVNTMPLETIEAFADHGEVRGQTATEGLDRASGSGATWPTSASTRTRSATGWIAKGSRSSPTATTAPWRPSGTRRRG